MPGKNERLERLGPSCQIIVSDHHGFTTDAILLSRFAAPRASDRACDLGTGCGIIPLLWCRDTPVWQITAVDIQQEACDQLLRTLRLNGLTQRVHVLQADLRSLRGRVDQYSYDLVVMNPPYHPVGTGRLSKQETARVARHEVQCSMDDAAQAAGRLLRLGGRFALCHRPERLTDVLHTMRGAGLELKRLRFVADRAESSPFLFLAEGKKGAKPGTAVLPMLFLHAEDGRATKEMKRMYGDFGEAGQ